MNPHFPSLTWNTKDADRLEQWWSSRLQALINMNRPLAATALFDEFSLEHRNISPQYTDF
jgi:hypothetical protein